jgi:hypothetical protein
VACAALAVAMASILSPVVTGTARATPVGREPATTTPCGSRLRPTVYHHVVWIVMENRSYGEVVGSTDAPYLNRLGRACGVATNYHAVSHPSLPNYLALTSGSTQGISDDDEPSAHPLRGPSIFSQLGAHWQALEESMPSPCDKVTSGSYAARHNPAVYYTSLGATCRRNDVPLRRLTASSSFTFITPNICHDMHDCSTSVGDAWLAKAVPELTRTADYRRGDTIIFIVWDESDAGDANRVPLYIVAPSVRPGSRVSLPLTHYSLLGTTERLLGVPPLGAARTAPTLLGRPWLEASSATP